MLLNALSNSRIPVFIRKPSGRALRICLACTFAVLGISAAGARLSGTYVAHDAGSAIMLQITQTDNGQITGVVSIVAMDADGKINSLQKPISGALDSGQITLSLHGGFAGLDSKSMSGTVRGDSIVLESLGDNGEVDSFIFSRASAVEFKRDVDEVRAKAESVIIDAALANTVAASKETLLKTNTWMSDAQSHVQKIAGLEGYYKQIEVKMRQLVKKERWNSNSMVRSQISMYVSQGSMVGSNLDMRVNAAWDHVLQDAADLNARYTKLTFDCSVSETELHRKGGSQSAIDSWHGACQNIAAEKDKFESELRLVAESRADLKQFQGDAQKRRQFLEHLAAELLR